MRRQVLGLSLTSLTYMDNPLHCNWKQACLQYLPPMSAVEVIESVWCVRLSICELVSTLMVELCDIQTPKFYMCVFQSIGAKGLFGERRRCGRCVNAQSFSSKLFLWHTGPGQSCLGNSLMWFLGAIPF